MVQSVSQKPTGKGEGRKRESAFVSQEIQSIEAKQVFLIMLTSHWSDVWKSGYTSLEKKKDKTTLIHTFPISKKMLYLEPNSI